MGKPRTGRALTNEIKYPYIVELPVHLKESVDGWLYYTGRVKD
jgi:hypothetical protein